MIAPTSRYGCGADDCVSCYGDEEWQRATNPDAWREFDEEWGDDDEPGEYGVFRTPFEQYRERDGEPYILRSTITDPDHHDAEVGTMYEIEFRDGTRIEAWGEELVSDEVDDDTHRAQMQSGALFVDDDGAVVVVDFDEFERP